MKTILVSIGQDNGVDGALVAAVSVARRFKSYIEGLFAQQIPMVIGGDASAIAPAYFTQITEDWRVAAREARVKFGEFMQHQDIPFGKPASGGEGLVAGWREVEASERQQVGEYGRLFDLIVIGRQDAGGKGGVSAIFESALFDSGRPVLLAPRHAIEALGRCVVIAWNGSTETARTIALGMPFIEAAEEVFVLTVIGGTVPGPSGQQVADLLLRHDVKAKVITVEPSGRTTGEAVLEEASVLGADLVLKGAYTHSRLRQMVFGGATRHILSEAELPILTAH